MSHSVVGLQSQSNEMKQCIQECLNCHSVCLETIQYCLGKGGKHADPDHIRLLENCAEICQTSANFMLTGSDFHSRTCSVCAEICSACAKSCEALGDDPQMKVCAEACRSCAESCQRMSRPLAA